MHYKTIRRAILAFLLILSGVVVIYVRKTFDESADHEKSNARKAAEKHTNAGKLLVDQRRYDDAVKEFEKALASDDTYVHAYEWLGQTYFMQNMFEEAETTFQRAVAAFPNDGSLHYNLAVVLGKSGRYREAVREYVQALKLGVKHAGVYHNLGISYGQVGKHEEAVESYQKGLESDPDNSNLHYDLGVECEAVNDLGTALKEYRIAVRLDPNNPKKLFRYAFICYNMYKHKEAVESLKKVISLDPSCRGARRIMGHCYMRLKDMEKAKRMLFAEIARFPNESYSHFLLAEIYSLHKETDAAIRELTKAVELNEDAYMYHYRLGQELFKQGKVDEAKKETEISEELRKRAGKPGDRTGSMTEEGPIQRMATKEMKTPKELSQGAKKTDATVGADTEERHAPDDCFFLDVTDSAMIRFKHVSGATGRKYLNETFGSGCGFLDYDNDGWMDIYLLNGVYPSSLASAAPPMGSTEALAPPDSPTWQSKIPNPIVNTLYRSEGNGAFADVTSSAGVGNSGYGMGCTFGDYDNDGDVDIYVTNFGPNVLYRNNGDGTFTDVADVAGVSNAPDGAQRWGTSCAFADYDNDGDIDLYVVNYLDYSIERNKECRSAYGLEYCHPEEYDGVFDTLYRNNGDGTFTDVGGLAGILPSGAEQDSSNPAQSESDEPGKGLGVVFGDYDNDGDLDIYVANDTTKNFLFSNNGDGTFTEVGLFAGVSYNAEGQAEAGMGTDFGDYDNDGRLDIIVTNFDGETNTLYHNEGGGMFSDTSFISGLGWPSIRYLCFGAGFFDYDNDGFSDIFAVAGHIQDTVTLETHGTTYAQPNLLFKNNGDGTFADVSNRSGRALERETVSRGASLGDYDNDGDLDILVSNNNDRAMLLQNEGGNRNSYLAFKTIGTRSNRDGIGARIKVVSQRENAAITQIKEIKTASSYTSQNDPRVFFGLGDSQVAKLVEIRWPSGLVESSSNVKANQFLVLREKVTVHPPKCHSERSVAE